jgi:transcriptional regulator with XRE-family HTH domain
VASRKKRTFGQVIHERRRRLDLTQQEVARRIKTSTPYIGHLEAGLRHPSDKVLSRLAEVLGLDRRDLFFLANPGAVELLKSKETPSRRSAWDEFRRDDNLRRVHNVSQEEMELLAPGRVAGGSRHPRRLYRYILQYGPSRAWTISVHSGARHVKADYLCEIPC